MGEGEEGEGGGRGGGREGGNIRIFQEFCPEGKASHTFWPGLQLNNAVQVVGTRSSELTEVRIHFGISLYLF